MNLGIEREMIGDIIMKESPKTGRRNTAYLFCVTSIADFIIDNLTRIKHTNVKTVICPDAALSDLAVQLKEVTCIAASPRIDAVIAGITGLSRSQVVTLFREKKVSLNSRLCENNSYSMKPDDILSVRGYGKYIYRHAGNETRKGRVYITLEQYI
jgi:RNA-binding protein YlmH